MQMGVVLRPALAPLGIANDHFSARSWGHLGPTFAQQGRVAQLTGVTVI